MTEQQQQNLTFLLDSMKYLGFGEKPELQDQLKAGMASGKSDFTVSDNTRFKRDSQDDLATMESLLYYRRSDTGMVFFNKYDTTLKNEQDPENERSQTFYINKGHGVTLKEAFNLLEGRAVNKDLVNLDGEKYNAWIQLNFTEKDKHNNHKVQQYTENYGYDLPKVLESYPLQLKYNDSLSQLIKSLEKGNRHPVTFEKDGQTAQGFMEASPKYKTVNLSKGLRSIMSIGKEPSVAKSSSNGKEHTTGEGQSAEKGSRKKNKKDEGEPDREKTNAEANVPKGRRK